MNKFEEIKEKDMQILSQLYSGLHLEDKELERAIHIIHSLKLEIKRRVR